MDSEDSREASSGSDSNDEDDLHSGLQSPASKSHDDQSSVSRSRSSTPSSRAQSALSQHSQETPLSPENVNRNRSRSPSQSRSRSRSKSRKSSESSDDDDIEDVNLANRPHTPKTPDSTENVGRGRQKTPESRDQSPESRSQSPDSRPQSPDSRPQSPDSRPQSPETRDPSPESRDPLPKRRSQSPESRIRSPENRIKSPESRIRSPESNIRSPENHIRSPESHIRSPESHIRSPESHIRSPESHIRSPESHIRSPESRDSSPEAHGQLASSRNRSPESHQSPLRHKASPLVPDEMPDQRINTPDSIGPESPMQSNIRGPSHLNDRVEEITNNRRSLTPQSHGSSRSSSVGSLRVISTSTRDRLNRTADKDDDRATDSSSSSRKSSSSRGSNKTTSSRGSRRSRRSRRKSNSSDSSDSSVDSSRRKITKSPDTRPEEISDGDIDSDQGKGYQRQENYNKPRIKRAQFNITHEDLSDVSDLEVSLDEQIDNQKETVRYEERDNEEQLLGTKEKIGSPEVKKSISEKSNRPEEGEEQLDFEAEDGECADIESENKKGVAEKHEANEENQKGEEKKEDPKEELEEGEVTDEDDVRPEETEPRPVCRFFSRGQCTWGASCRFLHPGVTDKGNYTMFELIRPVVPGEFGREERIYGKPEPPLIESAWERGLRTAKEMLKKSVRRKEQDIDFEEKKMNLSLAQEEFDKENGYYGRVPSPEPRFVRHIPAEYPVSRPPHDEYYGGRRPMMYEPEYVPTTSRERLRPYRELPSHRMPDYYNSKYEDPPSSAKRPRPKREVIVQRVEEKHGRGDEWSDPWMRSKSPAGRRKERKRSYSSGSSYSSSSTTESSRSSYRSRSRSSHRRRRSRSRRSRHVSPSVIVSERKAANERAALMNPPAPKKRATSPSMMRVSAANPPAPLRDELARNRSKLALALARVKNHRSSRSSSGSSGSSSSDSDSSDSSSSSSRDANSPTRRPIDLVKAMDALKGSALEKKQIKLNLKTPVGLKKMEVVEFARKTELAQSKKRPANSPPPNDPKSKKTTSRREELLKQLKAVEDAIAKKRSKVN